MCHIHIRCPHFRLQRFEKTNEMLSNCNTLSATRLERATRDFKSHTVKVGDMRKDLNDVLRRIHSLKQFLAEKYPQAFRGKCKQWLKQISKQVDH